jgi:Tol biopolymer transport system component
MILVVTMIACTAAAAPRRIGDGVISTSADEFGGAVTPDGKTIYFNRSIPRSYLYVICLSHLRDGKWSHPEVAPFSGTWRDSDPVLSPDGRRLYFASDRPWPGQKDPNFDIWVVDLAGPQPDVPRRIEGPVNSKHNEYFASEASDGTLYVASDRPGGVGGADVYRVKRVGDRYPVAEDLGEPVNKKDTATLDVLIAPDQSFLIMGTFGRTDGDSDLFLARQHDGVWDAPEAIAAVNTEAREYSPRFSSDGRDLIFTSERGIETAKRSRQITYAELTAGASSVESGLGNIYSIPLSEIGLPPVRVPPDAFSPSAKSVARKGNLEALPASAANLLAPGVISTSPLAELGSTFSPDGNEVYFVVRTPVTTSRPLSVICVSHRVGGVWQQPVVAPFSGIEYDAGPTMSPDGKRLFFSSTRTASGTPSENVDLWYVDRVGDGWSAPQNVGAPVNGPHNEVSPSVAADGTLYFGSDRPGGFGSYDLYRAKLVDGHYEQPENLGATVNSAAAELTPFITADQKLLLFSAVGRPDMQLAGGNPYARSDLYASDWNGSAWTTARRLPAPVNGVAADSYPALSRDGKTLFFTSERSPFFVPMPHPVTFNDLERGRHGIDNSLANIYAIPASDAGLAKP